MSESLDEKILEAASILSLQPNYKVNVPWRIYRTPYRVFLAEFLLVRTRTDIVADRFENIFSAIPNINSLASTTQEALEELLAPFGLRKRIPFLLQAGLYIKEEFAGEIPQSPDDLIKIPGIGQYTAAAISAFAFGNTKVPADVNILRFISRLTGIEMTNKTKGSYKLRTLLPMLSQDQGGPSGEKLLDFTRLVCKSRKPVCLRCPLNKICEFSRAQSLTILS